jgi:hypothetical protein
MTLEDRMKKLGEILEHARLLSSAKPRELFVPAPSSEADVEPVSAASNGEHRLTSPSTRVTETAKLAEKDKKRGVHGAPRGCGRKAT